MLRKLFNLFIISMFFLNVYAYEIGLDEFISRIEKNSLDLNKNASKYQTLIGDANIALAWDSPYVELESSVNGTPAQGNTIEPTALFLLKPKLPWVISMLKQNLRLQNQSFDLSNTLIKNINFIQAKRIYLTYLSTKEKYNFYLKREDNFLALLSNAKKRLQAGSISSKDYTNFKSAYIDSTIASVSVKKDLIELQRELYIILGLKDTPFISDIDIEYSLSDESIDSFKNIDEVNLNNSEDITKDLQIQNISKPLSAKGDIKITGLEFEFTRLSKDELKKAMDKSLYVELVNLESKTYDTKARLANRNRLEELELGLGFSHDKNGYHGSFQFSVPIPVTPKNSRQRAKFLELLSNANYKKHLTMQNINIKVKAYLQELLLLEHYANLALKSVDTKKTLVELNRAAYNAQKISLFEYINYENTYVDSQISLVNAKINYINTLSQLEEALGSSFTKMN